MFLLMCKVSVVGNSMYNNKFYGYIINSGIKDKKACGKEDTDLQKSGICGILNYLYSTNPRKKYYGLDN